MQDEQLEKSERNKKVKQKVIDSLDVVDGFPRKVYDYCKLSVCEYQWRRSIGEKVQMDDVPEKIVPD
jgi:hypothetical protein